MSPQIFGEKIEMLKRGMDYAVAKNRAISSNIANIETPGYKRFKVILNNKFSSILTRDLGLKCTHPRHISGHVDSGDEAYLIVKDDGTIQRADGNNVDIDKELAEMNANALYFTSLTSFLAKNFAGIRSIISEGKR